MEHTQNQKRMDAELSAPSTEQYRIRRLIWTEVIPVNKQSCECGTTDHLYWIWHNPETGLTRMTGPFNWEKFEEGCYTIHQAKKDCQEHFDRCAKKYLEPIPTK